MQSNATDRSVTLGVAVIGAAVAGLAGYYAGQRRIAAPAAARAPARDPPQAVTTRREETKELASSDSQTPYMIGIAGGTASGKSTVCNVVIESLKSMHKDSDRVVTVCMDRFYRRLTQAELDDVANHNFDSPDSFDWDSCISALEDLRAGRPCDLPVYDFKTHSRLDQTDHVGRADIVLFEGIFALYNPQVRKLLDLKVFVDADSDLRLARRLRRDTIERGRSMDGVLHQYISTVKSSFDTFIHSTKSYADIIVPNNGRNLVAVEVVLTFLESQLKQRKGATHLLEASTAEIMHAAASKTFDDAASTALPVYKV